MSSEKEENLIPGTDDAVEEEIHVKPSGATLPDGGDTEKNVGTETEEPDQDENEPSADDDEAQELKVEPRRSDRPRKPTERARQKEEDDLMNLFWKRAKDCKVASRSAGELAAKSALHALPELQRSLEEDLENRKAEINSVYSKLRETCHGSPPSEVRRAVDTINALTTETIDRVKGEKSISHAGLSLFSSHHSRTSSRSSARREIAAHAAALQAEIDAQKEEAEREEDLRKLEVEESKRRALEEATEKARRLDMDAEIARKRRELEHQKTAKKLRIEEAKLRVYEEEENASRVSKNRSRRSLKIEKIEPVLKFQEEKAPQVPVPQTKSESVSRPQEQTTTHSMNPIAQIWYPPATGNDMKLIAEALAASVTLSRLPVPEPPVFNGNALNYPDWKASFSALIESRGIPPREKIHYLRKYVGGPAKEAVNGYFLLNTDNAFEKAKETLEDRYGNPFTIAEAFRDKLEAWPKINAKDSKGLRRFADFLQQCHVAMTDNKGLGVLNDCRENRRLLQKLPDWLVTRWSRIVAKIKKESHSYPPFSEFVKFVADEATLACDPVTSLGALRGLPEKEREKTTTEQKNRSIGANTFATGGNEDQKKYKCILCKRDNHMLQECRSLAAKPLTERHEFVKKNQLCYGCLGHGHQAKFCRQRCQCKGCGGKHPTSLHEDRKPQENTPNRDTKKWSEGTNQPKQATCNKVSRAGDLFSSMVVPVWISSTDKPDEELLVYALLDTQSDTTFILNHTSEKLDTSSESVQLKLTTMTAREHIVNCHKFKNLLLRGYQSTIKFALPTTYSREFIPADRSSIPTPEMARRWPHLQEIEDKIPKLKDCEVGLLIGFNCPQALAPRNFITGKGNQPFAVETDLGWSIIGRVDEQQDAFDTIGTIHRNITKTVSSDLRPQINQFDPALPQPPSQVNYTCKTAVKESTIGPMEIIKILESDFNERTCGDKTLSQNDMRFLDIVGKGIRHQENGFYTMPLPFKNREKPLLPNNRRIAQHRLESLKRRFKSDQEYYQHYKSFMEEILQRGDAEKVSNTATQTVWYIPHHGVYHPKKPGKIRVVYDCSAKFNGTSLNDHLLQGPDLINPLIGVLCRFRKHPIAIMCDIEKMFHQFQVHPEDRDYLRFLWWEDGDLDKEPADYRMKVHLFGAVSSPGCANFGLKSIANDNPQFGPETVDFISKNFYVDDGLQSIDTVANAINLVQNARDMCSQGNLRLHKFASNSREVMEAIPTSERASAIKDLDLSFDELPVERALGIQWCIESDNFNFRLTLKDQPLTRRGILSTVASVYDPLGFVAPFVLIGKKILQNMCRDGTGWDDPLPDELRPMWEKWRRELGQLASIKIPRCYQPKNFGMPNRVELHHFSDASLTGYGQCSYLRIINQEDQVHCSLAMGKSRVTPVKPITIPRLELQAAATSIKIGNLLNTELNYTNITNIYWTDSKVVLGYINNESRRFHMYVANRVQRIRETTQPEQWHYINTEQNPADHASRGLSAQELIKSNWITGPSFLWLKELPLNEPIQTSLDSDDPEVRKVSCHVNATKSNEARSIIKGIEKFSSWSKYIMAITFLRLYIKRRKSLKIESAETERQISRKMIVKMAQSEAFQEEIKILKGNTDQTVKRKCSFFNLDPFLDEEGILRVGGRLKRSSLMYGVKHPIILPKEGHVTHLLIKHFHEKLAHQGRGMTINAIRSGGYWIVGCKPAVSSHIFKCVPCRQLRGGSHGQKMADLPKERLEESPPFTYCGIDCFGPFPVTEGYKERKRYGLLFTCLASRAVHIEVLDDMSTDSFLNGLRCLIAIRGKVRLIRCDQGSNFIGAKHELKQAMKEMDPDKIKTAMLEQDCDFVMNTPSSSHMGGVWERQIRTVRNALSGILDQSGHRLNTSALRTFLYEAMAIVNSRPLTTDNLQDPLEPVPLTPNHLLTMKSGVVMPAPPGTFPKEDLYARKRWRRVQYLANQFWCRWKKEYLQTLQSRQKWQTTKRNVQIGDVVMLHEDDKARCDWRLARVEEVTKAEDGLVRKVKILVGQPRLDNKGKRTSKALVLERPVHKLTVLVETPDNQNNSH
jgi:hypothetical protein